MEPSFKIWVLVFIFTSLFRLPKLSILFKKFFATLDTCSFPSTWNRKRKLKLKIFKDPRNNFGFCLLYFPLVKTIFYTTIIKALPITLSKPPDIRTHCSYLVSRGVCAWPSLINRSGLFEIIKIHFNCSSLASLIHSPRKRFV